MKMNWGPFMGDTSWRADTGRYTYLILETDGIAKLYEMSNSQPLCPINAETASQYAEFEPAEFWVTPVAEAKYHARMWAMARERQAEAVLAERNSR